MPAGRPREPKALKELKGTLEKSREKGLELPFTQITVEEVSELGHHQQKFLEQVMGFLEDFQVTHHLDKSALITMADMYAIYSEEKEAMKIEGRVIEVVNNRGEVSLKENPRFKVMMSAWDRLFKLMNEFGLTPNARARLATVQTEVDEMTELLESR